MNRALYMIGVAFVLLQSCKGTKSLTTSTVKKLKTERIIANHYNKSFNFKTLNAKIKLTYEGEDQSFSPNVTLRIEKDKKIWLSAKVLGITMAKALITPDQVSYYEKINGTYFEGDFSLLSEWLGTDLDYEKVQQMLLGQSLFNLRDDKYTSSIENQNYQLLPKKELVLFQRMFLIHPDTFKMAEQQFIQPSENRRLDVIYSSYQKVGNQDFPEKIYINAQDTSEKTKIKIEYRGVDYNAKVSFPFEIPSGYKEVTID